MRLFESIHRLIVLVIAQAIFIALAFSSGALAGVLKSEPGRPTAVSWYDSAEWVNQALNLNPSPPDGACASDEVFSLARREASRLRNIQDTREFLSSHSCEKIFSPQPWPGMSSRNTLEMINEYWAPFCSPLLTFEVFKEGGGARTLEWSHRRVSDYLRLNDQTCLSLATNTQEEDPKNRPESTQSVQGSVGLSDAEKADFERKVNIYAKKVEKLCCTSEACRKGVRSLRIDYGNQADPYRAGAASMYSDHATYYFLFYRKDSFENAILSVSERALSAWSDAYRERVLWHEMGHLCSGAFLFDFRRKMEAGEAADLISDLKKCRSSSNVRKFYEHLYGHFGLEDVFACLQRQQPRVDLNAVDDTCESCDRKQMEEMFADAFSRLKGGLTLEKLISECSSVGDAIHPSARTSFSCLRAAPALWKKVTQAIGCRK